MTNKNSKKLTHSVGLRAKRLPSEPKNLQNIEGFLRSWSEELNSRASRVRNLIGDAHWLSDGHHKEFLLREMLHRYLPAQLTIGRGFIKRTPPDPYCSGEIDILICDPQRQPPLFNEGGLQVVLPESVVAHFEIKTRMTRTSIREALTSQIKAQLALSEPQHTDVWRGIWFFVSRKTPANRLAEWIVKEATAATSATGAPMTPDRLLPNCIVLADRIVAFLSTSSKPHTIRLRLFEVGPIAAALGLLDFFAHRAASVSTTPVATELDRLAQGLILPAPHIVEFRTDGQ